MVIVGTAHYGKFLPTVMQPIHGSDRVSDTKIQQHPILARLKDLPTRNRVIQNDITLVKEYVAATVKDRQKYQWIDKVKDLCDPSSAAVAAGGAAVGMLALYLLKHR